MSVQPTNLTRTECEFECPKCSGDTFSPTYRQRQCTGCGHRGDAVDFATEPVEPCPDCGDENVKTHVDGDGNDVFTCKACIDWYLSQ